MAHINPYRMAHMYPINLPQTWQRPQLTFKTVRFGYRNEEGV